MVVSLLELAKTLDDPGRAILQGRADHWLNLLMWSTRLVLIGVAVEGIEFAVAIGAWIVRQVKRKAERADLKKVNEIFPAYEDSSKERRDLKWVKFVAFVGLVLVVVGVGGELDFEYKLETANGELQSLDNERVKAAQRDAEAIGRELVDAKKKTAAIESSATRIGELATLAGVDARNAQQDAAKVRVELNKAITDFEVAQLRQREIDKALNIYATYAMEHLSGPPLRVLKNDLFELLRSLPPATADVQYKELDPEAYAFACVIIHLLRSAGWNVPDSSAQPHPLGFTYGGVERLPDSGVRIFNKNATLGRITGLKYVQRNGQVLTEPEHGITALMDRGFNRANATKLSLLSIGLDADFATDETLGDGSFHIVVGSREPIKKQ
jgi:hypothetical protein